MSVGVSIGSFKFDWIDWLSDWAMWNYRVDGRESGGEQNLWSINPCEASVPPVTFHHSLSLSLSLSPPQVLLPQTSNKKFASTRSNRMMRNERQFGFVAAAVMGSVLAHMRLWHAWCTTKPQDKNSYDKNHQIDPLCLLALALSRQSETLCNFLYIRYRGKVPDLWEERVIVKSSLLYLIDRELH